MTEEKKQPQTEEDAQARQEDLDNRVKEFNAELIPLLGKHKLALGAIPLILPNGTLAAKPQLINDDKPEEETGEAQSEPAPETPAEGLAKPE